MATPRRLAKFPRYRVIGHELLRGRAKELDLLARLGEPTGQTSHRELDPVFYWDLEWPCGLVTALSLSQLEEAFALKLDEPEIDHALRHLGIDVTSTWLWHESDPEGFAAVVPHPPDRSWSVWRRGEGGRRTCLASGITERDARCWVEELDAADPEHPAHWAERLRSFPDAPPLPSRAEGL